MSKKETVIKFPFKIISFLLLFLIFFYLGSWDFVYTHERAHQEVFEQYGGKSDITINYFDLSGKTTLIEGKCERDCDIAQNFTDIIGYHWSAFTDNLWLMFFLFMLFHLWRKNGSG